MRFHSNEHTNLEDAVSHREYGFYILKHIKESKAFIEHQKAHSGAKLVEVNIPEKKDVKPNPIHSNKFDSYDNEHIRFPTASCGCGQEFVFDTQSNSVSKYLPSESKVSAKSSGYSSHSQSRVSYSKPNSNVSYSQAKSAYK